MVLQSLPVICLVILAPFISMRPPAITSKPQQCSGSTPKTLISHPYNVLIPGTGLRAAFFTGLSATRALSMVLFHILLDPSTLHFRWLVGKKWVEKVHLLLKNSWSEETCAMFSHILLSKTWNIWPQSALGSGLLAGQFPPSNNSRFKFWDSESFLVNSYHLFHPL